ncbi:MAG TPA: archease [Ktedonobacteraceae bacterium]|nr:archease [Ktedonobacteraceae bacterium]
MSEFAAKPYEVFEHTADVGLHASGSDLRELFAHVAEGMESLMVSPEQVRIQVSREINVEGHDAVSLLVNWLNELIFLFDTEYLIFRRFEIGDLTEISLRAIVCGEAYDAQRHDLSSAIKAATWHEAVVEQVEGGYRATVIFDI